MTNILRKQNSIAILCILSLLACCFIVSPAAAAGEVTLTVGTAPAAAADEVVTIPITASEVSDIVSFGFRITYDREKLEFAGWDSSGTALGGFWSALTGKSTLNDVNVNGLLPTVGYVNMENLPIPLIDESLSGASGEGILAKIKFKVLPAGANITIPVALSSEPGDVTVGDDTSPKTVLKVAGGLVAIEAVDPVVDTPVAATAVTIGDALSASILSGTFKNAVDEAVAGTLTWTYPATVVSATGDFGWTFTPTDTEAYNVITGTVNVVANPAPADKSALIAAIAGVNYVAVSTDGSDVESTDKWTTQAAKEALENAVADAQAVVDNADATQEEVDDAVTALAEAVSAYATAQQYGTKPAPLNKSALIAAIADAEGAKEGVAVSADGTDVPMGDEWVTQAALDALNNAIGEAEEALEDAVTQAEIDNAASDLNEAIDSFNSSVGLGTKARQITLNKITGLKPVRVETPKTIIDTAQYTGTVTWDPVVAEGKKFAASTVYYAQITITPKSGWILDGLPDDFFTVADASKMYYMPDDPGSFEAEFPKTGVSPSSGGGGGGGAVAPTATGIEIKSAPDKVIYTEGDALILSGLEVIVTYSDGNKKTIALKDFADNDITVSPKAGEILDSDVKEIVIKANGKTVKQMITVNKKDIVTPPDIEEPGKKTVLTDTSGHWAQDSIDYLVGIGAISGYPDGTFRPDAPITRAEFAKVIVDAFELKGTGKVFEDTAQHWAKNYIAIAAANGIVLGYNDDEFGPDDLITREQMAIIIVKTAGLTAKAGELDFIDNANISSWAYDWVVTAVENGLMSGYEDNSFKPGNNATRAEAVTVIYNVLMK